MRIENLIRLVALCLSALVLTGCFGTPKHLKPLSEESRTLLTEKGLKPGASMLVRIYKQDSEMEVWLAGADGDYRHFKTYEICSWSGGLGPKEKEGDKQAPEGFYEITKAQMNPKSKYHLSFNLGYPNAYDKAHKRTGRHLMVHGGCSSAGCYAVTNESVEEIYALARNAFLAGQRAFPVQAFPFRMTDENLAAHKGSKWYAFWKNIKTGHDIFEKTRRPPLVGVENGRYVFFRSSKQVPSRFQKVASARKIDTSLPVLISRTR